MTLSDPVIIAIANLAGTVLVAIVTLITRSEVKEVKHATNSMKDALVAAAKVEGHAEGVEAEKVRSSTRAATLAEGAASGQK